MSRRKEHKKGGKQYQKERKRKASEEGSVGSQKSRRSEGEKKRKSSKRQTPDQHQSQKATMMRMTLMSCPMSSCEEPAPTTNFGPFQDHCHPPIGRYI